MLLAAVFVTNASLVVVASLLALVVGGCLWLFVRARLGALAADGPVAPAALAAAALFLGTLGVSVMVLHRYSSDVPFYDQWWVEPGLYLSYLDGRLPWSALFEHWNEHVIFFTRLIALACFAVDRQWDNQVQALVCALIHSLGAVALFFTLLRSAARKDVVVTALLVFCTWGLPFAWENVLFGFQSQHYLLLLLSLLAVGAFVHARPFSLTWWSAFASATLALFTVGSGLFAGATLLALCMLDVIRRVRGRAAAVGGAIGAVLVIAGLVSFVLYARSAHYQANNPFVAHSLAEAWRELLLCLSWPRNDLRWPAPFLWAPILFVAGRALRGRGEVVTHARALLGVGCFVLCQAVTLACTRANYQPVSTRYADILSAGLVVNALALIWIVRSQPAPRWLVPAATAWFAAAAFGVMSLADTVQSKELPEMARLDRIQIDNIRQFFRTGDDASLRDQPKLHVPFPADQPDYFIQTLKDPRVRRILPASIREAIELWPTNGPSVFALESEPEPHHLRAWFASEAGLKGKGRADELYSQFLEDTLPYLSFEVAGYYYYDSQALGLNRPGKRNLDVPGGEFVNFAWSTEPSERIVRRPAGRFRIRAWDGRGDVCFSFSEPVELGVLSYLSHRILATDAALLTATLALLIAAAVAPALRDASRD